MKILQLPDPLYDFLVHVVETYSRSGHHPEESFAVGHLWNAVTKEVQHLDDKELRKMAAAGTVAGQSSVVPAPDVRPNLVVTDDDLNLQKDVYGGSEATEKR